MSSTETSRTPAWITSQRAARGLCQDCGQHPAATYWQSLTGPLICRACCAARQDKART